VPDEELFLLHHQQVQEIGLHLCGRRLYETMVSWETARKVRSSLSTSSSPRPGRPCRRSCSQTTLQSVVGNTRLAKDSVGEEVSRLKEQPGKDIAVGGAVLARECMKFAWWTSGGCSSARCYSAAARHFPTLDERTNLELVETKTLGSRVVYLRYGRVPDVR